MADSASAYASSATSSSSAGRTDVSRQLAEHLAEPERYGGLILTSPRAADALAGQDFTAWQDKSVFVVGPATAARARGLGLRLKGEAAGSAEALAADRSLIGEAFNFSNEIQLSVLDVVNKVLAAMDSGLEPDILGEASGEIPHQYLSARKARERLGWKPTFEFEKGLEHTVKWYRDYLSKKA